MQQTKITLMPARHRPSAELKSPEQLGLWPLKAQRIYPACDTKGLHYAGEVLADNGLRYFIKNQSGNLYIPISELVSYELCRAVSIATPSHDRIEMPDGTISFGSRNEPGSEDGDWLANAIENDSNIKYSAAIQLSRLVAVDAFLSNQDRAFKNLRWLPGEAPSSRPPLGTQGPMGALIAIDFSRAFLALSWPLPEAGFAVNSRSRIFYNQMRRHSLLEAKQIGLALDKLASLPNGYMEVVLAKSPLSWLDREMRDHLYHWWTSALRGVRIEEAERHLKNDLKISVLHH